MVMETKQKGWGVEWLEAGITYRCMGFIVKSGGLEEVFERSHGPPRHE